MATMYVQTTTSKQNGKTYHCTLIRQNYRENGKTKHRTVSNISECSPEEIKAIDLALKCKGNLAQLIDTSRIEQEQGKIFGAVFALYEIAKKIGIVASLGNTRNAKLCLWMILARLIQPGLSRLAAVRLARDHVVHEILRLDEFNEDDLYDALDWIETKQDEIEERLFKFRCPNVKPVLYLYDVTSSYLEGTKNELAAWGYDRDKKKGKMQIVIGLLTDDQGWPVSIEVFKGNTLDILTFKNQVEKLATRFKCKEITIVGDRGMIKTVGIEEIEKHGFHYITAITKPQIESLLKKGSIQIELFNDKLFEVMVDKTRYILRRNPVRVAEIEENRQDKIECIEELIEDRNDYLAHHPRANVNVALARVKAKIEKLNLTSFLDAVSSEGTISLKTDQEAYEKEKRLDGCYVIKSNLSPESASTDTIHDRYKDLKKVENAFRTIKTYFLEIRPVYLQKATRTRGHVFTVMLSYFLTKHLQDQWQSLLCPLDEAVTLLSSIRVIETTIGKVKITRIPKPSGTVAEFLKTIDVILPTNFVAISEGVATKKT